MPDFIRHLFMMHDLRLVALAAVLCLLSSFTAISLILRAQHNSGSVKSAWYAFAAVAAGYGVWATHFVSMLAVEVPYAGDYDLLLTIASALLCITFNLVAFALLLREGGKWRGAIAGAIVGLGISAMHYVGMAGWRVAAVETWNPLIVMLSVFFGLLLGTLAFQVAFGSHFRYRRKAGALLLTAAIVAMHFTAMGAVTLTQPGGGAHTAMSIVPAVLEVNASYDWLGAAIGVATLLVLGFGLIAAIVDQHFADFKRAEAERLRRQIEITRKSEEDARRLALVAQTTRDAIYIMDKDFKITWCNKAFEDLTEYGLAEVVGHKVAELPIRHDLDETELQRIGAAVRAGQNVRADIAITTKSGRTIRFETSFVPLRGSGGEINQYVATYHDVTERAAIFRRLRDSEARYELVSRGSADGIWDWNVKDDIVYLSMRLKQMLGYEDVDLPNHIDGINQFIHPEDQQRVQTVRRRHIEERLPYDVRCRIRLRDGSYRWFRVCGQAEWDRLGAATRVAGSISDINDLIESQHQAEEASRLKSEFLANMSHEIRTPLNGVMGMTQLLARTALDEKQQKYTDTILSASKSLLGLVNDILDLSKIEAGMMKISASWVDMAEIVRRATAAVEGVAAVKKIPLRCSIAPECLGEVYCDADRVVQVLVNLLGNAVKFTAQGEVTLRVAAEDGQTRFTVTDSGPGIAANQLLLIFERFRQVDGSSTRRYGGTGLGLTISRELVMLMKGQIGVDSVEGQGASFWFKLPIERKAAALGEVQVETKGGGAPRQPSFNGRKALVAEDTETNSIVIFEALRQLGFEVVTVGNGLQALRRLETERFDIVFMDIQMPVMNGDEAIRRIRSSGSAYANIPIVVTTANVMKGMQEKLLGLGGDAFVAKPIDFKVLQDTTTTVMNEYAKRRAA